MTDLEEDLTSALQRRAGEAVVEPDLQAILSGVSVIGMPTETSLSRRRGTQVAIAAVAAALLGIAGLTWTAGGRTSSIDASSTPTMPVGSTSFTGSNVLPPVTREAILVDFPNEVPKPDISEVHFMTQDMAPVGWEFVDQGSGPTESVERCTQYASSFGPDWTRTKKTDEAPEVLYAQVLTNGVWEVGVYCNDDGGYLVQVMRAALNPATCNSSGSQEVVVPDVIGRPLSEAITALQQAGLRVIETGTPTTDPTGQQAVVRAQEPPAGVRVPLGACVGFRTEVSD